MTFGYDAKAFLNPVSRSTSGRTFTFAESLLSDLSDSRIRSSETARPILFIGHSMGGIVIKSALCHAGARRALYGSILDSTRAIIFFGTPHQGSDTAVWGGHLSKLSRVLGMTASTSTDELQRWSNPLKDLTRIFSEIAPDFEITTFYEEKALYGVKVRYVS